MRESVFYSSNLLVFMLRGWIHFELLQLEEEALPHLLLVHCDVAFLASEALNRNRNPTSVTGV